MSQCLRIAVADDEPLMRMYLEEMLPELGHVVVAAAEDGVALLRECRMHRPDLVISDVRMPNMDGVQAMCEICREMPVPVVFVTGFDERSRFAQAERECVLVHRMKPVGEEELRSAIQAVRELFSEFRSILDEEPDVHRAMAARLELEAAKRRMADVEGITWREAFARLQSMAREQGRPLIETVRTYLQQPPTSA